MRNIKGLILCEGESDQILIGAYLGDIKGWKYVRKNSDKPFEDEAVTWYTDEQNNLLGIWAVGGCSFIPAIRKIMDYQKLDHKVEKVAVVTDYDDEHAIKERPETIYREIDTVLKVTGFEPEKYLQRPNIWHELCFQDDFSKDVKMDFCYLLVPKDGEGALETFMLKALSEQNSENKEVIEQVRRFLAEFKSDIYLKKRREKIKAELSVSISIFSPERMFDTLKEIIESVDWKEFRATDQQFGVLGEI